MAHGDGACIFQPFVALDRVERMSRGVERAVGGDEHVVAECHRGFVEYDKVEVGEEILPGGDIVAIVAVERLFDCNITFDFSEDVVQQFGASLDIRRTQVVVVPAFFLALEPFGD